MVYGLGFYGLGLYGLWFRFFFHPKFENNEVRQ